MNILASIAVKSLIIAVLIVAALAAFVYFGCLKAGRPAWGQVGAAGIVIVGALIILADYL